MPCKCDDIANEVGCQGCADEIMESCKEGEHFEGTSYNGHPITQDNP